MVRTSVQARPKEVGLSRRARSPDVLHGQGRDKCGRGRGFDSWVVQQEEQGIASVPQQSCHEFRRIVAQSWPEGWNISSEFLFCFVLHFLIKFGLDFLFFGCPYGWTIVELKNKGKEIVEGFRLILSSLNFWKFIRGLLI